MIDVSPDEKNGDEKAKVPQASYQKRLLGRTRGRGLVEPEADQEIAAQADPFPERIEQ